jgi:hypothetical protein
MAADRVFIFVPAYGQQVTTQTFLSLSNLQMRLMATDTFGGMAALSHADIGELRNMALTMWYDGIEASHLLMVDADMGFEPELVLEMLAFNEPVVGVIAPKRTLPIEFAGRGFADDQPLEMRGPFAKLAGVGMGVTLIRRDAVTRLLEQSPGIIDKRMATYPQGHVFGPEMPERLIRAFDRIDTPQGWLSEDLSFCERWRACGGDIWAHAGRRIVHVGPHHHVGCFLEAQAISAAAVDKKKIAVV